MVGPVAGAWLVPIVGFPWACTLLSGLTMAVGVVMSVTLLPAYREMADAEAVLAQGIHQPSDAEDTVYLAHEDGVSGEGDAGLVKSERRSKVSWRDSERHSDG
jgi:hypothetical protein